MFPDFEFWREQSLKLWDAIDELAIAAVIAGAVRGEGLLPLGIQQFVNYETFNLAAMSYLRRYQLTNVAQIAENTRKRLVPLLDQWLRSGEPLPVLEAQLATFLGSKRAGQVAVTEVTRLFADGNLMLWRSTGVVTSKVWRTANDELVCPLCGPLEGVTVEMEADFTQDAATVGSSPQMKALLGARWSEELGARRAQNFFKWNDPSVHAPPRHVNCRCSLHPVVSVQAYEELPFG